MVSLNVNINQSRYLIYILLLLMGLNLYPLQDYLKDNLEICLVEEDYIQAASLYNIIARNYFSEDQPDSALLYLNTVYQLGNQLNDSIIKTDALYNLGLVNSLIGKNIKARDYYKEGFELGIALDNPIIQIDHGLGKSQIDVIMGDFDEAYSTLLQLEELALAKDDKVSLHQIYYELGSLFFYQEDFKKALHYYEESNSNADIEDKQSIYNSLGAIASAHYMLGDIKSSLDKHKASLETAEEIDYVYGKANALYNIASCYENFKEFDQVLEYGLVAHELMYETYYIEGQCLVSNLLAETYANLSIKEKSLFYLAKALALSKDVESETFLLELYDSFSRTYQILGLYKESYVYLKKYSDLKGKLINEEKIEEVAKIKYQNELQKSEKDAEIALLNKDKKINRVYLLAGLIFLLASVLISILLLNKYKYQSKVNVILEKAKQDIEIQNKELASSNKALEQFAYIASHDLKEPLRTIGSYSSLLKRRYKDKLDEESKEYFAFISGSVKRLYQLLDDTMNYSKYRKKAELNEIVNLNLAINDAMLNLDKEINQTKAVIEIAYPLPEVIGEQFILTQLFENIISNSLKFQKEDNTPIISINYKKQIDTQEYLFMIKDNGIGIHKEYQDIIFEPFKRLNLITEYEGSGVGLAICKRIIEWLNGEIWVESIEDIGSCFYFTIPMISNENKRNVTVVAEVEKSIL